MATRTPSNLASGLVPSGLSNLVGPVPAGQIWYVSKLDFFNTAASNVEVILYIKTGSTSIQWKGFTLDASGGQCEVAADDRAIELNAGQSIQSTVSDANVVTYNSSGVIEQ